MTMIKVLAIPIQEIYVQINRKSKYFLANLYWEDNEYYDISSCFYIRPNYYTKKYNIISIKQEYVTTEFRNYLYKQIEWMKRKALGDNKGKTSFPLRVCFKARWRDMQSADDFVYEMCLHCCESKITDLPKAINVYYHRVHKIYRDGLSRKILLGYISEYKHYLENHNSHLDDLMKRFISNYYELLICDIQTICDEPKGMRRWLYKGKTYNTINLFVMLDDILFGNDYYDNKFFIDYIISCPEYNIVLYELKGCEIMRKCVYEKTILKYTSSSYEDFEDKILIVIIEISILVA